MARRSKKIEKKLNERVDRWEKLQGTGSGARSKVVAGIGTIYHKPGSQNLRKHN